MVKGIIIGAAVTYLLSGLIYVIDEEWLDWWIYRPITLAWELLCYPIVFFWKLFRNAVKPITWARYEAVNQEFGDEVIWHKFPLINLFLFHDTKAKRFVNRWAFVRVR